MPFFCLRGKFVFEMKKLRIIAIMLVLIIKSVVWGQDTVTDIDGNVYETVQIGEQLWMAENLKDTHYNNSDEIPTGYSNDDWAELDETETGAYAVYEDDPSNAETYGNLYNWYAVDDSKGMCPEGWHIPTDEEIKELEMYLGMSESEANSDGWRGTDEGGKLKEAGITHWASPNTGATNESGFTALPCGSRFYYDGIYQNMGGLGYFWSSSEDDSNHAWNRLLSYNFSGINRQQHKKRSGFSVRCVTDVTETGTILVPQDYPTIQAGIDAASEGDTVLVAAGTYYENINYNEKNIVVGSLYLTTGDTFYISQTVIDGNQSGSVVTFDSIQGSAAVLAGFTITGGNAYDGGGIYCTSSAPTIRDNIITGNVSETYGGGISCNYSSVVITNNTITSNSAYYGGGISFDRYTSSVINGNNITKNVAEEGGGIGCFTFSSPSITNNTISGNSAGTKGGGIYCYYISSPTVTNTIIWDNTAPLGPDIYVYFSDPLFNYCDVMDGWDGEGNIDADPLFANSDNGDFTLQEDSPCIDAGTAFFVWEGDTLVNMSPDEYVGSAPDMGAYEYGAVSISNEPEEIPQKFALYQNYPNPFNPITTIRYDRPEGSDVTLTIYDITGRMVQTLVNESQQAGIKNVVWNATDVSSGVYIYRIQAGEFTQTRKMILLK